MNNCLLMLVTGVLLAPISHAEQSPYRGEETREIKSLSAAEVENYLSGSGMGLAKAAELNGYPGPKHVLELASELRLSKRQVRESRALFERMRTTAIALGRRLVESERVLDAVFAGGAAERRSVRDVLDEIARLQAELRFVHLDAHLEQTRILSAEQVALYLRLRGYTADGHDMQHGHEGH